ncbi:hypothetical protein [Candidatus Magnetaquicoccus inordinatus]|uniref:hypothetical protein n=1 Tax=Candidatus Magnetaquicoccus inordinatus TaxID=2496818 RepID=UPI00102C7E05|nr:hypothetical protein [Candidatus Magnetaquicoccus inordinatus]
MEEFSQLALLLHQVRAQRIGLAYHTAEQWLNHDPDQLHSLHMLAHILLNVTQRSWRQTTVQQEQSALSLQHSLQRLAQAQGIILWLQQVQKGQQRDEQQKLAYQNGLQQWLQKVERSSDNQEAV